MEPPCQGLAWLIPAVAHTRYNQPVKLDMAEDDMPLLVRALEHYAAYLEATKRPDQRYLALAEELKRKHPETEGAKTVKSAKRRA
jgi:hypothetical protein